MSYSARILADSVSPAGDRVTTMEITYPRMVHAEFMTHRVFSRNAASSRAIPVKKTIERVKTNPAMPAEWGTNQKGMQAGEPLDAHAAAKAEEAWLAARDSAVEHAEQLLSMGLHKQVVNRVLEPFTWITVIVTGTDWDGFFKQRATIHSPLADPTLRVIADMMHARYQASVPTPLGAAGQWHAPFIDEHDAELGLLDRLKVSAARCARVSYLTHDGRRDHADDLRLFNDLVTNGHWSPLEHVCTFQPGALGNLTGFSQLRHAFELYGNPDRFKVAA
jgi:thymidylate synthase ThyX